MTRKLKPTEIPVGEEVKEAILSSSLLRADGRPTTLGELISEARLNLDAANNFLRNSPLIKFAAENLMREEKKRGNPSLFVSGNGDLLLRISWGEETPEASDQEALDTPGVKTKLPSLDELREKARVLGVDISGLGRQKYNIIKVLQAHEEPKQ